MLRKVEHLLKISYFCNVRPKRLCVLFACRELFDLSNIIVQILICNFELFGNLTCLIFSCIVLYDSYLFAVMPFDTNRELFLG